MSASIVILTVLAFLLGAATAMLAGRGRSVRLESEVAAARGMRERLDQREHEVLELRTTLATRDAQLESERDAVQREQAAVERMREELATTFKALSAQTLDAQGERFLALAKRVLERQHDESRHDLEQRTKAINELVRPLRESLTSVDQQFRRIEKEREGSYRELLQQVRTLETTAGTLATALRAPKARGRWGELQLRRVVELAGMVQHCDFCEQASGTDDEGARLQPDLVVQLPAGKSIVVDAKTPMDSYLAAIEATDGDERGRRMSEHAARIRDHVRQLSAKEYWKQFDSAPELVVLFLPGEDLFSAALERDPALLEFAAGKGIAIATPTTLITTLRAVAQGWREERLAENARHISELGRQLYERAAVVSEKWAKLGNALDSAVGSYNDAVASFETRFLVTARKFPELEVASTKQVRELEQIDTTTRAFAAPELVQGAASVVEDVDVLDEQVAGLSLIAGR